MAVVEVSLGLVFPEVSAGLHRSLPRGRVSERARRAGSSSQAAWHSCCSFRKQQQVPMSSHPSLDAVPSAHVAQLAILQSLEAFITFAQIVDSKNLASSNDGTALDICRITYLHARTVLDSPHRSQRARLLALGLPKKLLRAGSTIP